MQETPLSAGCVPEVSDSLAWDECDFFKGDSVPRPTPKAMWTPEPSHVSLSGGCTVWRAELGSQQGEIPEYVNSELWVGCPRGGGSLVPNARELQSSPSCCTGPWDGDAIEIGDGQCKRGCM